MVMRDVLKTKMFPKLESVKVKDKNVEFKPVPW